MPQPTQAPSADLDLPTVVDVSDGGPALPKRTPGRGPAPLETPDWGVMEDTKPDPVRDRGHRLALRLGDAPSADAPAPVTSAAHVAPATALSTAADAAVASVTTTGLAAPLPPPEPKTEDDLAVERMLSSIQRQLAASSVFVVSSIGISPKLHRAAGDVEDDTALALHELVVDAAGTIATGVSLRGADLDVLGTPVVLPDGTLYGSMIAFAPAPGTELARHGRVGIEMLSTLVADIVHIGEVRRHERAAARARTERALFQDAMSVVFQPQVDLASGTVLGYEALARFEDGPDTSTPDVWFREAHELGLGAKLEARAIHDAFAIARQLPEHLDISVNVSAAAIGSQEIFDELTSIPAHRIIVELTDEHDTDINELVSDVERLRALGIRISMDDLGAGYADLQRVMRLRPDILKLDRGLVSDVNDNPAKAAMVTATTILAGRLGAMLVAEGVETMAEAFTLRVLGVPAGQGWHYGRPIAGRKLVEETLTGAAVDQLTAADPANMFG